MKKIICRTLIVSSCLLSFTAFAEDISEKLKLPNGYLKPNEYLKSATLLPTPPEQNSPTKLNDEYVNKNARQLYGSERWRQAGLDSNILYPSATKAFACAANIEISPKNTPALSKLLEYSMTDIALSVYEAKNKYQRPRPFMENNDKICEISAEDRAKYGIEYKEDKESLVKDGSYPSGHSAVGWGWALILSEVVPERANQIMLRGRSYAESRMICNVHWQSDTLQGRLMASAAVARMHANAEFQKDLKRAKKEVARLNQKYQPDASECQREKEALKTTIYGVM